MALKILVTGDIHIGKKSSSTPENTPISATKTTWLKLVDYAIQNKIDAVALTGDVVDQNNRYFEAIGPLQSGFERLLKANIEVFMVSGNHDYKVLSQLVDNEKYPNIHLLGKGGTWEMKTFEKGSDKLQFVGWSFPSNHFHDSPLLSFNLPALNKAIPSIGLLHGDVDVPDSRYAPINSNQFLNLPVNAWMLGHIHKPQIINNAEPLVLYPGSPHALSAKETGAHGPVLLTIQSPTSIEKTNISLSPVRYESVDIDLSDLNTQEWVRNKVTQTLIDFAENMVDELEHVAFLIFDIHLIGRNSNIEQAINWVRPIIDDFSNEVSTTETLCTVRKVKNFLKSKVDNLEELAKVASPTGVLAQTILALEKGESTAFADQLLEKWEQKQEQIRQLPVYQPIQQSERFDIENHENRTSFLMNECNKILTELIEQQK
ncbi:DNA repair exonuclease [Brumimicrobium salinarum]|uniref:DNA repair exonuclease n=1 Tax=Brumimicrobium salinarum TaxID=2058658 RepID=A0A2I0R3V1_9FLAO|nr:DNA repair exonuclease [Brumimicrobium salinarum]PKR81070.1 DNA repair exonuclease [Brumimicrobium salinarum]